MNASCNASKCTVLAWGMINGWLGSACKVIIDVYGLIGRMEGLESAGWWLGM